MPVNDLSFHLPLDEIRFDPAEGGAYVANVGDLGSNARVHGNPQIIDDPELGSCLLFDGVDDFVELTGLDAFTFADGMSAAAWVRFDATQRYSRIFDLNEGENSYRIVRLGNQAEERTIGFAVNMYENVRVAGIEPTKWQHFAVTYDTEGNIALFIDGKAAAEGDRDFDKANIAWKVGYVGKSSWDRDALFKGAMAHFRLYNRALSAAEIQATMQQDKSRMAHYRETTLLKVDLYTVRDDDHKPILTIESDNRSEPLELAVTNPTNKPIAFKPFTQPTEDDFHLQFRFRRHVIAPNIRARLEKQELEVAGWRYLVGTAADGRSDYLSFVKTDGATAEGAFELAKGATELLRLPEFSAAAQGGARNTRIEVRFRVEAQDPGSVIRHMEIQSHLGLKTVPLIARVVGSNTLLNDGNTANELKIEILYARMAGAIWLSTGTRFELAVDRQLIKDDTLSAATTVEGLDAPSDGEGADGFKTFVFKVQKDDLEISRTRSLTVDLSNWVIDRQWEIDDKTVDSSGAYNILLRYENIPGYWDGAWVLPVQLSPLVMRAGKVGIGTDDPQAALHVRGDTLLEGNVSVGGSGDGAITVRHVNGKSDRSAEHDVLQLNYDTGKNVEVGSQTANADLIVHGNLAVGTINPPATLQVNGRIKDQTGDVMPVGAIIAYAGVDAPDGWLLCIGQGCPYYDAGTQAKFGKLYKTLGKPALFKDGLGRDHFYVPDLRSRFIVGAGQGSGNDEQGNPLKNYAMNSKGGSEKHKLTLNEMPKHTHSGTTDSDGKHKHTGQQTAIADNDDFDGWGHYIGSRNGGGVDPDVTQDISETGSEHKHGFTTSETGNDQAHNNLPPYYTLTYIIKY